jgi:hypothetical protein
VEKRRMLQCGLILGMGEERPNGLVAAASTNPTAFRPIKA